jgi:hypothetical protein
VLPKGLQRPPIRIANGLQVLRSLLEQIASDFQGLDLIFKALDWVCIAVCPFNEQRVPSAKSEQGRW